MSDSTFSNGILATPNVVALGGTGDSTLTAYAPLFGGTTSTGAVQSGTVGTSGQVLTSNGPGALPTMQTSSGGEWTYLSKITYAAASGAQSFTSLSVHDSWKLVYRLSNTSSVDESQTFTLNNIGGTGYDFMYETASGAVGLRTTQAFIRLVGNTASHKYNLEAEVIISGKHQAGQKAVAISYCSDGNYTINSVEYTTGGSLSGDSNDLTRIDVNSVAATTGTVELWFKDSK